MRPSPQEATEGDPGPISVVRSHPGRRVSMRMTHASCYVTAEPQAQPPVPAATRRSSQPLPNKCPQSRSLTSRPPAFLSQRLPCASPVHELMNFCFSTLVVVSFGFHPGDNENHVPITPWCTCPEAQSRAACGRPREASSSRQRRRRSRSEGSLEWPTERGQHPPGWTFLAWAGDWRLDLER